MSGAVETAVVASAVIGVAGSIYSANEASKAQKKATRAQQDAQAKAASAVVTSAGLSATVSQLQQQARKLATRLDAAKHTADLAAAVRSKTAGADAAVLADMLGRLAEEARYYAGRADESYRAGMTCERIHDSVRESNSRQ